jgi:hypothetical protein
MPPLPSCMFYTNSGEQAAFRKREGRSTTCGTIIAACLLLALPVILTRPEWQSAALWGLAGFLA